MTDMGSSDPKDRRQAARRKSFLRGKVVYNSGGHSLDCTIRDMSATGARLGIAEGQVLPRQFFLLDMKNRAAHEVEVKWKSRAEIGVQILRSVSMDAELPRDLQFLHRLWSGSFAGYYPDGGLVRTDGPRQADTPVRLNGTTPRG